MRRNKPDPYDAAPHNQQPAPDAEQAAADAAQESPESVPSAEELTELRARAAQMEEWKSKCLYTAAELENLRKRHARERRDLINYAGQDVLSELLDIVDNFGRALEADRSIADPKVIVDGIEIIYNQMRTLLERFGVSRIEALGKPFDPNVHEAIQHVPTSDAEEGTVTAELQPGYMLRDRVLRPARVVVAAPMSDTSDLSDLSDLSDRN
jgi:molecular chaperone GrpE